MINVMKTFLGLYTNHLKVLLYDKIKGGMCSFFTLSGNYFQRAWKYITFGTDSWFIIGLGIIEVIWQILRYCWIIIAFIYFILRKKWSLFFLFGSWIAYFAGITGFDGCSRFRFMLEGQLLIIGAVGFVVMWNIFFNQEKLQVFTHE
jgi:hypothetical protein